MILPLLYMVLLLQHATAQSTESNSSIGEDIEATVNIQQDPQDIDVNGTIAEVEQMLADNPDLPRLSRDEIMEILSNITSEDQTTEHATTDKPSREEYMRKMRALMLVLPFNARNLTESKIKELYTKAPITRLVSGIPYEEVTTTQRVPPSSTKQPLITVTWSEEPTVVEQLQTSNHHHKYHEPFGLQTSTMGTSTEHQTRSSQNRRRRPPAYATTSTPQSSNAKPVVQEQQPTSNHPGKANTYQQAQKSQHSPPAYGTSTTPSRVHVETTNGKSAIQEPQPTSQHPEKTSTYHRNNQRNRHNQQAQKIHQSPPVYLTSTSAPGVYAKPAVQEHQPTSNYPEQTNTYHQQAQKPLPNRGSISSYHPLRKRKKTTTPAPTTAAATNKDTMEIVLPSDMKQLVDNFEVQDFMVSTDPNEHMFVTPSIETMHFIDSATKQTNQQSFTSIAQSSKTDEIQGILASLGLFPQNDKANENFAPQQQRTTTTAPATTTTTAMPDISAAVESLTPEMKDLLISFGLLPSENDIQPPLTGPDLEAESSGAVYNPQASPVVDPSSYLSFKPLPLTASAASGREEDNYALSSDMKQFLASFGLVSDNPGMFRSQKSLQNNIENLTNSNEKSDNLMPQINVEMLSQDMQDVLENLGFISGANSTKSKRKTAGSAHIFNPSAHLASLQPTAEEAKRLTKLLDTVKKIVKENATLSQKEIEMLNSSIAFILPPLQEDGSVHKTNVTSAQSVPRFVQKKKKITSLDQVKDAPDPLSVEELLINVDVQKNEVKRQQSSSEASTDTAKATSTATESSSTTTTTDAGPSLTDLAASFGGGETASSDADIDEALPPPRPNGLYFLLDWNSFLDVGIEGERRINLRFTPKLGNPRAFIPVTVP